MKKEKMTVVELMKEKEARKKGTPSSEIRSVMEEWNVAFKNDRRSKTEKLYVLTGSEGAFASSKNIHSSAGIIEFQ